MRIIVKCGRADWPKLGRGASPVAVTVPESRSISCYHHSLPATDDPTSLPASPTITCLSSTSPSSLYALHPVFIERFLVCSSVGVVHTTCLLLLAFSFLHIHTPSTTSWPLPQASPNRVQPTTMPGRPKMSPSSDGQETPHNRMGGRCVLTSCSVRFPQSSSKSPLLFTDLAL